MDQKIKGKGSESLLSAKLVSEMTRSKQSFVVALKRLLYMPAVNVKAHEMIKEFVGRLKQAGFEQAANTLWVNVAAHQFVHD